MTKKQVREERVYSASASAVLLLFIMERCQELKQDRQDPGRGADAGTTDRCWLLACFS